MTADEELRFDGRVAIVTGAGGQPPSLGRAYACYLAARGAKVVVNDLGVGPDGRGGLAANADAVVQEIVAAGGEAVADTHSVADAASATAVVQTAIDAWGRVDVVVNNAGILAMALFDEITEEDCEAIVGSHLLGAIWMCRAAWPHMRRAGYGRIVNTSAGAMFGFPYNAVYGAAKAGVLGLSRGLALEGSLYGIKVNAIAPEAVTRKRGYLLESNDVSERPASGTTTVEQVAPVVAVLCHERCPLSGSFVHAGGGRVSEYVFSRTAGHECEELTMAHVLDNLDAVTDRTDAAPVQEFDASTFDAIAPRPYVPRGRQGQAT